MPLAAVEPSSKLEYEAARCPADQSAVVDKRAVGGSLESGSMNTMKALAEADMARAGPVVGKGAVPACGRETLGRKLLRGCLGACPVLPVVRKGAVARGRVSERIL